MLTFSRILSRTLTLAAFVGTVGLFSDFVRDVSDDRTRQCTAIAAVVFLAAHVGLRRRAWVAEGLFVGALVGAAAADVLVLAAQAFPGMGTSWPPPLCMFVVFGGAAVGAVAATVWRVPDVLVDDPRGRRVEDLTTAAEVAAQAGDEVEARRLFAEAAEIETDLVWSIPRTEPRILGLVAVSAVALWRKAGRDGAAHDLAFRLLAVDDLPREAREQLVQLADATANTVGVAELPKVLAFLDGGRQVRAADEARACPGCGFVHTDEDRRRCVSSCATEGTEP